MSDTPPPELVDACARSELNWDERLFIEEGGEEPWLAAAPDDREVYREGVRRILAALAEWADGGLIDPSTWTVVEVKPAERWHNLYDLDGKVICNHPERDHCSRADEGDWSNWTYTLRARGGDPR